MTGTNHDPDVDQLLRDDGAQWRASLPPSPDPYPTLERRATRARAVSPAALLASFAGVLAVLVVGILVVVSLPSRDHGFAAATATPATSAPSVTPAASQPVASPTATPSAVASENTAEAACSAILDSIPDVIVISGEPTVAAAYEVTGTQLTSYFVKTLNADPNHTNGSDWWDQPTKLVDMCLYDGDFRTMTPGPPGHDTSATRVLVVISDGDAQFWASTLNKSAIPATDPAAIGGALPPTSAGPEVVLDAYLRALRAGDCDTGRKLATATFVKGNGELCGATHVSAYQINPEPARPSPDETVFGTTLTTTGTADGSIQAGEITWFYSLGRQPDGSWRIVGGGSGP